MKHYIVCFLMIFIVLQSQSATATEFSRKAEFGPMRFTVEQIAKISNELLIYIQSVNNPSNDTKGTVDFESERYNASFDLPLTAKNYDKIPDNSYSFRFSVRSYDNNLSSVVLSFGDSYRYAEISGLNHSHVTGLLSIVQDKVRDFEVKFGGSKFRVFLAIAHWGVLLLAYVLVIWRYDNPKIIVTALLVFVVLPNAVVHLFPWYRIFPGTLITHDPLSFLQKYSHIFTFLGFLLAIITIAWPMINKRLKRPNEPEGRPSE